jgi:hypothetical protein
MRRVAIRKRPSAIRKPPMFKLITRGRGLRWPRHCIALRRGAGPRRGDNDAKTPVTPLAWSPSWLRRAWGAAPDFPEREEQPPLCASAPTDAGSSRDA